MRTRRLKLKKLYPQQEEKKDTQSFKLQNPFKVRDAFAAEGTDIPIEQRRKDYEIAIELREKDPEWYAKNVGKVGEMNMFGHTLTDWGNFPKSQLGGALKGLDQVKPDKKVAKVVSNASKKNNVNSALIVAMLWQESGYSANAKNDGGEDGIDRGIAQINSKAHPEVSDEQAYDYDFAIKWMAKELADSIEYFDGDISKAVASYNVGRGGVENNLRGETPFGGGKKGQAYIDGVSKNLTKELRKKLGLKTTY